MDRTPGRGLAQFGGVVAEGGVCENGRNYSFPARGPSVGTGGVLSLERHRMHILVSHRDCSQTQA